MKKGLAVFFLIFAAAAAIASLDFSIGAQFKVQPYWQNFKFDSATAKNFYVDWGVAVFFDATYVKASLGYDAFAAGTETKVSGIEKTHNYNRSYLDLGLYGKYPFRLGFLTLFPLAGINYRHCISNKDNGGTSIMPNDKTERNGLNQFWIKAGAGADIAIGEKFYIRPAALFGFLIPSKAVKEENSGYDSINSMGLELSFSVGYKF